MKQYIAILFIFALVFTPLFSDGNLENEELMVKKWDLLWDTYDYVDSFYGGLALVGIGGKYSEEQGYLGGKWGFVDTNGVEVIPVIYDSIGNPGSFDSGKKRVRARLGKKYGLVDKKGNFTVIDDYNEWLNSKLD